MIKPAVALLILVAVTALIPCVLLLLWGVILCVRNRARKTAVLLCFEALIFALIGALAVYVAMPGSRTIAKLTLPDGREFVVRHYRTGWLKYPEGRFYARDLDGNWTSFFVDSHLVYPHATLVYHESTQHVELSGVACGYWIRGNIFECATQPMWKKTMLPLGVEPGDEMIK